jgi:hypothetical protein
MPLCNAQCLLWEHLRCHSATRNVCCWNIYDATLQRAMSVVGTFTMPLCNAQWLSWEHLRCHSATRNVCCWNIYDATLQRAMSVAGTFTMPLCNAQCLLLEHLRCYSATHSDSERRTFKWIKRKERNITGWKNMMRGTAGKEGEKWRKNKKWDWKRRIGDWMQWEHELRK